jgi:hypothetical protein
MVNVVNARLIARSGDARHTNTANAAKTSETQKSEAGTMSIYALFDGRDGGKSSDSFK